MALVSLFVLPDWPEKASFLTSEERTYLLHRLAADAAAATMNVWTKKTSRLVFGDVKIYLGSVFSSLYYVVPSYIKSRLTN